MFRFVVAGLVSGILFGVLDGLINANPLALQLYSFFSPITRKAINVPAGIAIDLMYGFVMAAVFIMLYKSLPGGSGLGKGLTYGFLVWFFRVVMQSASQWIMFKMPAGTLCYALITGLAEMLILGLSYGLILKPAF